MKLVQEAPKTRISEPVTIHPPKVKPKKVLYHVLTGGLAVLMLLSFGCS